jgi:hypothetical protein
MLFKHYKRIAIILLLILAIFMIWVLNQKKHFNPIFSLKTNFSFKSNKDLNYNDLSSVYHVYQVLKVRYPDYVLDASVTTRGFSVIGRVFKSSNEEVLVFEYEDSINASEEHKKLYSKHGEKMIVYKNLIVLTSSQNDVNSYLRENLK